MKVFINSVPSCTGTSAEAVRSWYIIFCKIASTTGFYLHPYYCFWKLSASNYGFTCGFDTAPITFVPGVPEVLYQAPVLAIIAVIGVSADPAKNVAEVVAVAGSQICFKVLAVPEVLPFPAQVAQQNDLPGIFQNFLEDWNYQIYIAMSKPHIFKNNSRQQQIVFINPGQGYMSIF